MVTLRPPHISRVERGSLAWKRSLAIVCAVFVCAVAFAVHGMLSSPATPTAPPAGAGAPTDTAQDVPTTAPNVAWVQWMGASLPDGGRTYGPSTHDGPDAVTGWSASSRGALLAEINATYRGLLASDAGWRQSANDMLADNKGRALYMQSRAQYPKTDDPGSDIVQLAGFRFVFYSPRTLATIALALSDPTTGNLTSVTSTVIWESGTWKLVLRDDGTQGDVIPLATLTDYVSFVPGDGAHA